MFWFVLLGLLLSLRNSVRVISCSFVAVDYLSHNPAVMSSKNFRLTRRSASLRSVSTATKGTKMFIDENTSRADLIKCWHEDLDDMGDMVDAMIEAGVDPDKDDTPTEAIRAVIIQWIEDGDECGAA